VGGWDGREKFGRGFPALAEVAACLPSLPACSLLGGIQKWKRGDEKGRGKLIEVKFDKRGKLHVRHVKYYG
jgi:hypothetical protein